MAGDKGKGRDHELSEVEGNVKTMFSAVLASAAILTHNVFSKITSYELLGNTIGTVASLNKGQLSNSSSTDSSPFIENRVNFLPNLNQSRGFQELKLIHDEQHLTEFEKEYSRFLSNFNSLPYSRFSQIENPRTEKSHTTFCFTENSKRISSNIIEQEHRDGEEIVNLLMSFAQEECEHEASEVVNTFNSSSLGYTNDNSHLNFKENFDNTPQQPINLLGKAPFNFLPSFENQIAHYDQWMDLQEKYTEKVWGDRWEAIDNPKQADENSDQLKSRQTQNIAKRRLEAICCHLRQRKPKLETHFLF